MGEVSMDREKLLEAASQLLGKAIILLTAAGEDRLALDLEEIATWVYSASAPPESTTPSRHKRH
jgi:hypothetical protein